MTGVSVVTRSEPLPSLDISWSISTPVRVIRPSRSSTGNIPITSGSPVSCEQAERTRRQRELVEQDRDLQRKRREFQEDLNQRKNEELASVVERANRVIKQIFDQEKYDVILQEVVFASTRIDITDKVIKALNAGPAR